MPMWRGYGTIFGGWALAEEGHPAEGAARVLRGIEEFAALGTVFHRSHQLGILAGICGRLGDPEKGLSLLDEARDEVRRTEVYVCQAELCRIEGELRSLADEPDAAEACFAQALALAHRQEARSFELRAATSLARLWRERGKPGEARGILGPVYGWFSEGFDTPDLKDAKAVLDTLS